MAIARGVTPAKKRRTKVQNPSEERIQEEIDLAIGGTGKFSGATYEQGVIAALEWVLGKTDDVSPMED